MLYIYVVDAICSFAKRRWDASICTFIIILMMYKQNMVNLDSFLVWTMDTLNAEKDESAFWAMGGCYKHCNKTAIAAIAKEGSWKKCSPRDFQPCVRHHPDASNSDRIPGRARARSRGGGIYLLKRCARAFSKRRPVFFLVRPLKRRPSEEKILLPGWQQ